MPVKMLMIMSQHICGQTTRTHPIQYIYINTGDHSDGYLGYLLATREDNDWKKLDEMS